MKTYYFEYIAKNGHLRYRKVRARTQDEANEEFQELYGPNTGTYTKIPHQDFGTKTHLHRNLEIGALFNAQ